VQDAELGKLLGFFYDRIASAELGEERLTYDLSVPDNVTYIANGFVSHNTIGLLMDCDTTGVEPDFALVKFKKLAGGGYFKIVNQSVPAALEKLGYTPAQVQDIVAYVTGSNTLLGAPRASTDDAPLAGLSEADLARSRRPSRPLRLQSGFSVHVLGEACLRRLGSPRAPGSSPTGTFSRPRLQLRRRRGGERGHLWADDGRGRAGAQVRSTSRCLTAPTVAEAWGSVSSPRWATFKMMAAVQPFISAGRSPRR
jgi:ribonucleotide reductase alpha subunit